MDSMKLEYEIKRLLNEIREITDSEENKRRISMWNNKQYSSQSQDWRAECKSPSQNKGKIAYCIDLEYPMFCKMMGDINLEDYYKYPEIHLLFQLKLKIFRFKNLMDDTVIDKNIIINMSQCFIHSFFGKGCIEIPGQDPIIDYNPVLNNKEDLNNLLRPNFYKSGLMPKAHKMYKKIKSILKNEKDFSLIFPSWETSPWSLAYQIRGFENLALDIMDDPFFVHRMMRFFTDCAKEWIKERSIFLGEPIIPQQGIGGDTIDMKFLSPQNYEEFVSPYLIEMANFQGGAFYWHSCGNITALVEKIQTIPNLRLLHISPWSDLEKIVPKIRHGISLEICLHPVTHILNANSKEMSEVLLKIINICGDIPYYIRADSINVLNNLKSDWLKVEEFTRMADSILHKKN